MTKGRVVAGATAAERRRLRATIGTLRDLRVGKGVQRRYKAAVSFFLWYCWAAFGRLADNYEELDRFAVCFIHAAWQEGEPRSVVADTLSGLLHFIDRKKIIPTAWSWLTTWEQHEMPTRAHPLSSMMVCALSGILWHHGFLEECCVISVAFCGMLRTAELLELRRSHVSFGLGKASLVLCGKTGTRTGSLESAVIDDAVALRLLRLLCDTKRGPEKLLSGTPYSFRRRWKWAIRSFHLNVLDHQPYGLRRGGACEDFAQFGDGPRLCLRGRWGSVRTARVYAEEALRVRQISELSKESEAAINYWATEFQRRFAAL